MKRILIAVFVAVMLWFTVAPAMAQQQSEETVSVPKSMLNKDQLDALAAKDIQDKIEHYGKWVGVGHEVGVAVNESLTAVTTQANNFAQTPVGKWMMFIVIWKVIGHDLMGFALGALIIIIGLPIWIWSYRRYLPHKVPVEISYDTSHYFRRVTNIKYQLVMSEGNTYANGYRIAHFFFLAILVAVALITMFGAS
jgi:hypothetical protein